jgi:AbrB family looped-hinge helix DNA binding protein
LTVEVGKYGRIILPKKLRQKYGVTEGIRLIITEQSGYICLVPVKTHKKPTQELYGSIKLENPIEDPKNTARDYIRKKLVEDFQ